MSSATTGNMTWGQIRRSYIEAAGDSTAARQESFAHLTQGFREVVQFADEPELFSEMVYEVPEDPLIPDQFQDFIEIDENIYHIDSFFNLTVSAPVYLEPSGMQGRDRYIDANPDIPTTTTEDVRDHPKPPPGQVRWYWRHGSRIYLRDSPDRKTKLRIRWKVQPDAIVEADINDHPFSPAHLDWAIVWKSAANYYKAHRDQNMPVEGGPLLSQYYDTQADQLIKRPVSVMGEEEKTSFHRIRVAGYRITPRTRRGGY